MHYTFSFMLFFAALVAGGTAAAQSSLSVERSGLGLRPASDSAALADWAFGAESTQIWQARRTSDFSLYGGARETPDVRVDPILKAVRLSLAEEDWRSRFDLVRAVKEPRRDVVSSEAIGLLSRLEHLLRFLDVPRLRGEEDEDEHCCVHLNLPLAGIPASRTN